MHDALVEELQRVFIKHNEPEVLSQIGLAFRHLLGTSVAAAPTNAKEGKSRRKSSVAGPSNAETSASNNVRRKMAELCEDLLVSNLEPTIRSLADRTDGDDWDVASVGDSLIALQGTIRRWDALLGNINVADLMRTADLPEGLSLFDCIRRSIERCVQIHHVLGDHADADSSWAALLEDTMMMGVEILFRDLLFETLILKDQLALRIDDIDSGENSVGPEHPVDESGAAAQTAVVGEKGASLLQLCSRLLGGSGLDVPLSVRATTVKTFAGAMALAHSDLGARCTDITTAMDKIPGRVLDQIPLTVDRVVALSSGLVRFDERASVDSDDEDEEREAVFSIPKLPGATVKLMRYHLGLLVGESVKLVRDSVLPLSAAPCILKWLGVGDEYEKALHRSAKETAADQDDAPEIVLLPAFWDKVVGAILGDQLIGEKPRAILQLSAPANTSKAQAETLEKVKEGLTLVLDDIVVGSFKAVCAPCPQFAVFPTDVHVCLCRTTIDDQVPGHVHVWPSPFP